MSENIDLFHQMKLGGFKPGECVLRAKIDMSSPNMHMRDPVLYRIMLVNHHRTGDKWKIYPTYDWPHGQSDYIEKISHSFTRVEVTENFTSGFFKILIYPVVILSQSKENLQDSIFQIQ